MKIAFAFFAVSFFFCFETLAQVWEVSSPDKKITVTVANRDKLTYTISYNNDVVIEPSPLGLQLDDQRFMAGLKLVRHKQAQIRERYMLITGKRTQADNPAHALTLTFENASKKHFDVIFRAYNDGVAFRYHLPSGDQEMHTMTREASGFAVPKRAKAWIQPYDLNVRNKPCYETYYEDGIAPGAVSPNAAGWAFPALFNVGQTWMLITEAGLDETYCATHLEDRDNNGVYTIRFPEKEEVTSDADPAPVSTLPWVTPWRVVVIGNTLTAIQNTSLITDVNPPSKLKDTSWIKPGRASWSWWSNGGTTRDYHVQKEYIDFNVKMGWEYVLIDAGWPQMFGGKIEDLIRYANSKGVGIFLWYHSGMGRERDTVSMENLMAFSDARREEFEKIKGWGVRGIKVDFFDSDKQPVIKRYFDILRDAADYNIMVNFHGSTLPRGWERTYPHLMSMESVKGAEGYGRQAFCDKAPSHNTILPFTRNAVGSMDYTPVTFTNKRDAIRRTSFGHELALSVVFESGVFHFADRISAYEGLPEAPKNFLKHIPVVWDETQCLSAVPGKYAVVARRKGNQWYIGGINGEAREQTITFTLPVKKNGMLNIITDGATAGTFSTTALKASEQGLITISLLPNGGFVGMF